MTDLDHCTTTESDPGRILASALKPSMLWITLYAVELKVSVYLGGKSRVRVT